MAIFSDSVFKGTVFNTGLQVVLPDESDTHDFAYIRRHEFADRDKPRREEREEILRQIRKAFDLIEESPKEAFEEIEEISDKAERLSVPQVDLNPVLAQLAQLQIAFNLAMKERAEREAEEEILIMLAL